MKYGEQYRFRVAAKNKSFISRLSEPLDLRFGTAPSAPFNLREDFTKRELLSTKLTWDQPEDFGGYDYVTYTIHVTD